MDNAGIISAGASNVANGAIYFEQGTLTNEAGARLIAQNGGIIQLDETTFDNFGTVAAGSLASPGGVKLTVQNTGSAYELPDGTIVQAVSVVATSGSSAVAGGAVLFEQVSLSPSLTATLTNEAGGIIEAANAGELAIDAHGQTISNAGLIAAQDGGTVLLDTVVVNNTNNIEVNSSGSVTQLQIVTVTLQGGGQVLLSDYAENVISSDGSDAAVLTNVDNTISGAGTIGDVTGSLFTLINDPGGTIDAGTNAINSTGTNALVIANDSPMSGDTVPSNAVVNEGLIEATGSGGLAIVNSTINNAGVDAHGNILDGQIQVTANSQIELDNANILHGFFTVDKKGEVETAAGSANIINTANGSSHNTSTVTISNAGTMVVNDNSSLTLISPYNIENSGTIELQSTTDQTFLYFNQGSPVLSGGGDIILEGGTGSHDIIAGLLSAGFTTVLLDNQDNMISGAGAIGQNDGDLTLQNDAAGIVDADLSAQTLLLHTGSTDTNTGLMEATSGGILQIEDVVDNTNGVVSGMISVADSLSILKLTNATIVGGLLDNSGVVEVTLGASKLQGVSVTDHNLVDVLSGAVLTLDSGTQIQGGGTGKLTVENGAQIVITASTGATLDGVEVTDKNISPTAPGIDPTAPGIDVSSGALTLDDGTKIIGGGPGPDLGTLAVESGGQLLITTASGATLDGMLVDDDNTNTSTPGIDVASGAVLTLDDGTQIWGGGPLDESGGNGTLTIESGGELSITSTNGATLDGLLVLDKTTATATPGIDVASGAKLELNDGTVISGGILSGGTVVSGTLGTLNLESGSTLLIDPGSGADGATSGAATLEGLNVTDLGTTLEVTSGATLTLDHDTFGGSGTITIKVDAGGTLNVDHSFLANVILEVSGSLNVTADSTIEQVKSGSSGPGEITVDLGQTLTLIDQVVAGTINNYGTIDIETGTPSSVPHGARFDDVGITNYATTDGIVIGGSLPGAPILTLDDGTSISGGYITLTSVGALVVQAGTSGPISGATLDDVIVDDDGMGSGANAGIYVASGILTLTDGTRILGGGLGIDTYDGTLTGDDGPGSGTLTISSSGEVQVTGAAALDGVAVSDLNPGTTNAGIDVSGAVLTLNDSTVIVGGEVR